MDIDRIAAQERAAKAAGMVDGRHYTAYVPEVRALLKSGDSDAAAGLLMRLAEAVEAQARVPDAMGGGIAPAWYHDHLAAILRRAGREVDAELVLVRLQTAQACARAGYERMRAYAQPIRPTQALAQRLGRAAGRLVRKVTGG